MKREIRETCKISKYTNKIQNIEKFFQSISLQNNFENFFQPISLQKNFENFLQPILWKKFRKFFIVNFKLLKKIFFTAEFIAKNSKFFYSQFHWKKISKNFQKIRKKFFCLKNKKRSQGGNAPFFPVKFDTTFHWVLMFVWKNWIKIHEDLKQRNITTVRFWDALLKDFFRVEADNF